jgi:hypothetical protein
MFYCQLREGFWRFAGQCYLARSSGCVSDPAGRGLRFDLLDLGDFRAT